MPTYEYTCPDGHDFERFYRKISDAATDVVCPVCGKPALRKLSPSGFAFKGSGFYLTDYGKNAHRGAGEVVGAAEKSSESSGGETKSDAKSTDAAAPAAKAGEPKSDSGAAPAKAAESKSSESKSGDAKRGESKPSGGASPAPSAPAPKSDK
jgi:putative FmdB family regulatory protein